MQAFAGSLEIAQTYPPGTRRCVILAIGANKQSKKTGAGVAACDTKSSRKKWQINLGEAGTIDRFDLAFQYQINFFFYIYKKNGQKQSQIKNTI